MNKNTKPSVQQPMEDFIGEKTVIKVIGVGGGGGNSVNRMIEDNIAGAEFVAMNTDAQVLSRSKAPTRLQLGKNLTKGRGAGANPDIGRRAAEESIDEINEILDGTQMVFLTAGMGGGTGTGAIPVIAKAAKEKGILTIAIVTKPFSFEGCHKARLAAEGITNLMQFADSLIVIPNDRLKMATQQKLTLLNAFAVADSVLKQGVSAIASLVGVPAFINLDYNDVRSIMKDAGYAHMGVGIAQGDSKAIAAAEMALHSPLLETEITGAMGVVINFTVSPDASLDDIETAAAHITDAVNPEANIIWGVSFDEKMNDTISITLVATGFDGHSATPLRQQIGKEASYVAKIDTNNATKQQEAGYAESKPTVYIPSQENKTASVIKQLANIQNPEDVSVPSWATNLAKDQPVGIDDGFDQIKNIFSSKASQ